MSLLSRREHIAIPSSHLRARGSHEAPIDPHASKQARQAGTAKQHDGDRPAGSTWILYNVSSLSSIGEKSGYAQ
jgi:hypothetical protein